MKVKTSSKRPTCVSFNFDVFAEPSPTMSGTGNTGNLEFDWSARNLANETTQNLSPVQLLSNWLPAFNLQVALSHLMMMNMMMMMYSSYIACTLLVI